MNFDVLNNQPRLLIEAQLHPVQGARFQPTGFPDLGAAEFDGPDGRRMLLVESHQSVANHLERAVFKEFTRDTVSDELADAVSGLPYVDIDLGEFGRTSTLLEAHRLNTPYLWDSDHESALALQAELLKAIGIPAKRKKKGEEIEDGNEVAGVLDMKRFYRTLLKYDINSLLHGVFLEKVAGRLRLPRVLTGFIEAVDVSPAQSGGVKNDHVFPKKDETSGISSKEGYTNVPFPRTEFVAKDNNITAYFNVDLALIRGFGLGEATKNLLIALSLYKIRRFLDEGLRLRSYCALEVSGDWKTTRPGSPSYDLPTRSEIESALPTLIDIVTREGKFVDPRITRITWSKGKKKVVIELPRDVEEPTIPDDLVKDVKWKKGNKNKGPALEVKQALDEGLITKLCELFPSDQLAQEAIRSKATRLDEPAQAETTGQ